jgi:uncharacterized membrane protein
MPWYAQWIVGIGAWITALVLVALGGAIYFVFFDFEALAVLAVIGIAYLALGLSLLQKEDGSVFRQQLGVATSAAGAALVSGGIAAETEELWLGFTIAVIMTAGIVMVSKNKTLQFLVAALAAAFFVSALMNNRVPYLLDLAALATPMGLFLLLRPPRRDLMPTAIVLLGVFPVLSVMEESSSWVFRNLNQDGTFAQVLHILLFLSLAFLHSRKTTESKVNVQIAAFATIATAVCLLLPPGGSAAMLIMMLAFVIGSKPFALLGAALQAQFIARYYYSLDMNLFDKSLLLIAVGALLLAAWWVVQQSDARGDAS